MRRPLSGPPPAESVRRIVAIGLGAAVRRRLRSLLPVLALALALPASVHAGMFGAESFTLDNGLQVVVIPDRRAPVVAHMVWYRVGSADEEPGRTGLAHFLEHLMFRGTEKVPDGEFSYVVARHGGTDNASTSHDYTVYRQNVARDRLALVMELEADRMTNLVLSAEQVEVERDVVLEERRTRIDDDPGARLGEELRATQYHMHPYGWPVIGWRQDIEALTHDDLLAFYRRHYGPDNAIVLVAGDVATDEVRLLAERHYGGLEAIEPAPRGRVREPVHGAARRVTLEDARVAQPSVQVSYLAPSYATGPESEAFGLEVLAEALSGSTTSRLYRRLVVEREIAASAGAWYGGDGRDGGRFTFWIVPALGRDVEAAEAALRAEIEAVIADGITEEELERAQSRIAAQLVHARDSVKDIARWYGAWLAVGLGLDRVEAWPERVARVSLDEVQRAARTVLRSSTEVTGVLLKASDG